MSHIRKIVVETSSLLLRRRDFRRRWLLLLLGLCGWLRDNVYVYVMYVCMYR